MGSHLKLGLKNACSPGFCGLAGQERAIKFGIYDPVFKGRVVRSRRR